MDFVHIGVVSAFDVRTRRSLGDAFLQSKRKISVGLSTSRRF